MKTGRTWSTSATSILALATATTHAPGRFFAANEIKIIALAHMLLKYDWKLAEGTAELKPLAKGQNLVCNPAIKLLVRRRRE